MMKNIRLMAVYLNIILVSGIVFFMLMIFIDVAKANNLSANVQIRVTVYGEPCDIYPGDEAIELDFGAIVNKYLYLNTRTHSQPFTIRLINCDISVNNEVKVTFIGTENQNLPGFLSLDDGSQANGIAVGIETASGEMLSINNSVYTQTLSAGNNNELNFQAYIQGEPIVLQNKSLVLGQWTATATFKLDYE